MPNPLRISSASNDQLARELLDEASERLNTASEPERREILAGVVDAFETHHDAARLLGDFVSVRVRGPEATSLFDRVLRQRDDQNAPINYRDVGRLAALLRAQGMGEQQTGLVSALTASGKMEPSARSYLQTLMLSSAPAMHDVARSGVAADPSGRAGFSTVARVNDLATADGQISEMEFGAYVDLLGRYHFDSTGLDAVETMWNLVDVPRLSPFAKRNALTRLADALVQNFGTIDQEGAKKIALVARFGALRADDKSTIRTLLDRADPSGRPLLESVLSEPALQERADWNFVFYMAGDSNLAPYVLQDLLEAQKIGSIPGKVHVVAFVDDRGFGVPEAFRSRARPGRLFLITKDEGSDRLKASQIALDPFSDLRGRLAMHGREVDMGDPLLLRNVLQLVERELPSEHTALNLWGHGSAAGSNEDSSHQNGIAPDELDDVFRDRSSVGEPGPKVDLVLADACALQDVGFLVPLQQSVNAEYFVAAPELVPLDGMDYRKLFENLATRTNPAPSEVAHSIVDTFAESGSNHRVFSAVRLRAPDDPNPTSAFEQLWAQTDQLAERLLEAGGLANPAVLHCFRRVMRYGDRDRIDLGDFARLIASTFQDGPLTESARSIVDRLGALTYTRTGPAEGNQPGSGGMVGGREVPPDYTRSMGISLYAPYRGALRPDFDEQAAGYRSRLPHWLDMMQQFETMDPVPDFNYPTDWAKPKPDVELEGPPAR